MTVVSKTKTKALLFRSNCIYVDAIDLEDFGHMQELLGGDCVAIEFPKDILLWCANQWDRAAIEHTLTIVKNGRKVEWYGNLLFTSNDSDCPSGISSLTDEQTKWLSQNFNMSISPLHGNHVFEFCID